MRFGKDDVEVEIEVRRRELDAGWLRCRAGTCILRRAIDGEKRGEEGGVRMEYLSVATVSFVSSSVLFFCGIAIPLITSSLVAELHAISVEYAAFVLRFLRLPGFRCEFLAD